MKDNEIKRSFFKKKIEELLECEITPSQAQCLLCYAEGKTVKETALSLFISLKTVKFHNNNILRTSKCNSRMHLFAKIFSKMVYNSEEYEDYKANLLSGVPEDDINLFFTDNQSQSKSKEDSLPIGKNQKTFID